MKCKLFCLMFLLFGLGSNLNAQNTQINFSGVRSSKGQIILRIYKDEKSFEDDNPSKIHYFKKSNLSKGKMTASITLEPGTYGLALADDENNSNLMDFGFLGVPSEGFGFSNYYHAGFTSPSFDSFKFTVAKNQKYKISMKIRYM